MTFCAVCWNGWNFYCDKMYHNLSRLTNDSSQRLWPDIFPNVLKTYCLQVGILIIFLSVVEIHLWLVLAKYSFNPSFPLTQCTTPHLPYPYTTPPPLSLEVHFTEMYLYGWIAVVHLYNVVGLSLRVWQLFSLCEFEHKRDDIENSRVQLAGGIASFSLTTPHPVLSSWFLNKTQTASTVSSNT